MHTLHCSPIACNKRKSLALLQVCLFTAPVLVGQEIHLKGKHFREMKSEILYFQYFVIFTEVLTQTSLVSLCTFCARETSRFNEYSQIWK